MCRKNKIAELKRSMSPEQSLETKFIVTAGYVVANLIAQKSKSYSDGEFIEQCMKSVADIICTGKKKNFLKLVCLIRLLLSELMK